MRFVVEIHIVQGDGYEIAGVDTLDAYTAVVRAATFAAGLANTVGKEALHAMLTTPRAGEHLFPAY